MPKRWTGCQRWYIQNLREIPQAVWLLQGDLHSDLRWPPRSDLTSSAPHNSGVSNISYLMKFFDWRPPYAQKLHFKVLGITMGTFWAPPTQDLTCPKGRAGCQRWHIQNLREIGQAVWSLEKIDDTFWTTRRRRRRRRTTTTTLCALRSVGFAADKK